MMKAHFKDGQWTLVLVCDQCGQLILDYPAALEIVPHDKATLADGQLLDCCHVHKGQCDDLFEKRFPENRAIPIQDRLRRWVTRSLEEHEVATLVAIAEKTSSPQEATPLYPIHEELKNAGHAPIAVRLAINILLEREYIETIEENAGYPEARVLKDGWAWLEANRSKFSLRIEPKQFREEDIPF